MSQDNYHETQSDDYNPILANCKFEHDSRFDSMCSQLPFQCNIFLVESDSRISNRERPRALLLCKHETSGSLREQRVTLSRRVFHRVEKHPELLKLFGKVIRDVFELLLDSNVNPIYAHIHLYVSPSDEDPYDNELVLRIRIPRSLSIDWMKFWTELDQRIFSHIPTKMLLTEVERVRFGTESISDIREEDA